MFKETVLSYDQGIEIANETAQRFLQEKIALSSTGSGSTLSVALPNPIPDKYIVKFICNHDTSGNITINNIACYKPGTTTSPSLKNGRMYEFWYNAATPCFFFKASASGNAKATDVLAGKTFSNDDDTDIVGNIQNKGAVTLNVGIDDTYNYSKSYFESLQVKPNIIRHTSGTTGSSCVMYDNYLYTRMPEGYYNYGGIWDNGAGTTEVRIEQAKVASAIGLHSGILLAGQNILGIGGNVQPRRIQTGTATSTPDNGSVPQLNVTGLSFQPIYLVAISNDNNYRDKIVFIFDESNTLSYNIGDYSTGTRYWRCTTITRYSDKGATGYSDSYSYSNGTFTSRLSGSVNDVAMYSRSFNYVAIG